MRARALNHIYLPISIIRFNRTILPVNELRKTSKRNPALSRGRKYIHRTAGCAFSYKSRRYCKQKHVLIYFHNQFFTDGYDEVTYQLRPVVLVACR